MQYIIRNRTVTLRNRALPPLPATLPAAGAAAEASGTSAKTPAARSAGAPGGTVLHAKGTGAGYAEKFFGVSLAEEKDVVLIAAKAGNKAAIMQAVAEKAGPDMPAGAIAFSLPVSAVAGLRDFEEEADAGAES